VWHTQKLEEDTCFAKCPIHPRGGLFDRRDRVSTKRNLPSPLPEKHLPGTHTCLWKGSTCSHTLVCQSCSRTAWGDAISPAISRFIDEQPHLEIPSSHEPGSQSRAWSMLSCVVSMQLWFMSKCCVLYWLQMPVCFWQHVLIAV